MASPPNRDTSIASPYNHPRGAQPVEEQDLSTPTSTTASKKRNLPYTIFEKIRLLRDGHSLKIPTCGSVYLRRRDFKHLYALLQSDEEIRQFAFGPLRLYYLPEKRKLTYRMAHKIHQGMASNFNFNIKRQLQELAEHYDGRTDLAQGFADYPEWKLIEIGSEQVADITWDFTLARGAVQCCCIVEVAYSQTHDAALDKLRQLLRTNAGRPGLGIIIKIGYNTPEAFLNHPEKLEKSICYTVLRWEKTIDENGKKELWVRQPIREAVARNKDGVIQPGKLEITMQDFIGIKHVHADCSPDITDGATQQFLIERLVLTHEKLAEALKTAEQSYMNRLKFPPKADSDSESSSNKSDTTSEKSANYSPPKQKDPTCHPGRKIA